VAWRIKLLGFNTIRLPFSFKEFGMAPRDPKYTTCSSAAVSEEAMAASVTPPGVKLPAGALPPRLRVPAGPSSGVCNDYIPMESVRTRFLWACKWLAANGFYVVIDDHMAYDTLVSLRERFAFLVGVCGCCFSLPLILSERGDGEKPPPLFFFFSHAAPHPSQLQKTHTQ
jgi:hypothetical protein